MATLKLIVSSLTSRTWTTRVWAVYSRQSPPPALTGARASFVASATP